MHAREPVSEENFRELHTRFQKPTPDDSDSSRASSSLQIPRRRQIWESAMVRPHFRKQVKGSELQHIDKREEETSRSKGKKGEKRIPAETVSRLAGEDDRDLLLGLREKEERLERVEMCKIFKQHLYWNRGVVCKDFYTKRESDEGMLKSCPPVCLCVLSIIPYTTVQFVNLFNLWKWNDRSQ